MVEQSVALPHHRLPASPDTAGNRPGSNQTAAKPSIHQPSIDLQSHHPSTPPFPPEGSSPPAAAPRQQSRPAGRRCTLKGKVGGWRLGRGPTTLGKGKAGLQGPAQGPPCNRKGGLARPHAPLAQPGPARTHPRRLVSAASWQSPPAMPLRPLPLPPPAASMPGLLVGSRLADLRALPAFTPSCRCSVRRHMKRLYSGCSWGGVGGGKRGAMSAWLPASTRRQGRHGRHACAWADARTEKSWMVLRWRRLLCSTASNSIAGMPYGSAAACCACCACSCCCEPACCAPSCWSAAAAASADAPCASGAGDTAIGCASPADEVAAAAGAAAGAAVCGVGIGVSSPAAAVAGAAPALAPAAAAAASAAWLASAAAQAAVTVASSCSPASSPSRS